MLRELATSAVRVKGAAAQDAATAYPVRTLEVPRFTTGIPAALVTLVRVCGFYTFVLGFTRWSSGFGITDDMLATCVLGTGRGLEAARARAACDRRLHDEPRRHCQVLCAALRAPWPRSPAVLCAVALNASDVR